MSRLYLSPPHLVGDERDLVRDAFDSNWIAPLGPHVDAFEREVAEVAGVGHAAALSSGTAALHLALRDVGVEPGDRVLVSTMTFVASASPIRQMGAEPVFIDCDDSWNLDPNLVEEEIRALDAEDVTKTVYIRKEPHSVVEAIQRQIGHYGYHVGQIVQTARALKGADWVSLSIPRGESDRYNEAMGHPTT